MGSERRLLPVEGDWAALRAGFRWPRPERFNIAAVCCDSHAAERPGALALIHVDEAGRRQDWSYGQIKRASDRLANAFAARGIGKGDRVAVLLAQSPEVLITHFAAYKLGAVVLPLFTLFGAEALAYRLSDSGTKAIVTDAAGADKVMGLKTDLPVLEEVYTTGPAAAPLRSFWSEVEAASDRMVPADTLAEDPAVLIYTSGTTGPPKGVLHAHRFLIGHLPSFETAHAGFPRPSDCGWTPADWAWIGGLMDMAIPCFYYGVPLVSHRMRRFDPEAAYALIARNRIRNLFLPPTALKLMRQARLPHGLQIRSVSSGGESLGAEIHAWGVEALRAPINELYGQTECNLVIGSSASAMEIRPGAMGQAVPGFEVAVIDAEGQPVAAGALGEIGVARGSPAEFLRYWGKPEKTAEKFVGDWLRTGDIGRRDAEGYFTYVSRDDDVITSAGYRIGPTEIENCLTGHPDVVMAAVVGEPDPVRTEVVVAHVVLKGGRRLSKVLSEALIQRVRERVSPHVAPKRIVAAEALPMTETGKIMRRILRNRQPD